MTRRDDVNELYERSNRIQKIMKLMFIVNIACSLIVCIFQYDTMINTLMIIQILISILYVALGILDNNFLWYNAEKVRRETSIENGLGIEITEYKTEKYYNNNIKNSIIKFSINAFESVLFSKTTASRMIFKETIKTVVALSIFICGCLVYKNYNILLIICQTVFSAYIIEDFITLILYKFKLEKLYDDFYTILITIGINSIEEKNLILVYAIEYETIKAHYKVRLSESEFNKHNDETSLKWEEIYKKIKIK